MITITVSGDVQQSTNPSGDLVLTVADAVMTPQVDVQAEEAKVAEDVAHAAEVEAQTFVAPVAEPTPVPTPTTPVEGV